MSQSVITLTLRVQPKSPRTQWGDTMADGTRKVRIAAAPERGKANEELIRFLAGEYNVPRVAVEIRAGASSHLKQVRIQLSR